MYYREGKFWPIWAILSRTDEIFGDKYKVWLMCLWELGALEHVESTRMQVGWWVGQRMKPSVDGGRGDRSGWKLVGNPSKWERPVGETTQAGARISHYRQNQNNPTLTKSRQTRAPFSVYMRDVGNFRTKIHSVQIWDTYFTSRAVRCLWCVFWYFCEYFHLQINKIEKCLHWCGLDPSNKARAVYIYLSPKIYSDANTDWEQFF